MRPGGAQSTTFIICQQNNVGTFVLNEAKGPLVGIRQQHRCTIVAIVFDCREVEAAWNVHPAGP